jgi:DNA invertase Pin-like site-specific DNA recombinase
MGCEITQERQRKGIAKAAGKYKGRPVSINAAQIKQLRAEFGPAAIARRLGIARRSAVRVGNGSEPLRAREIATYCQVRYLA